MVITVSLPYQNKYDLDRSPSYVL